ncbi:Hint domain-containing protein [Sagittula sp. SSi028]|uniref:Hint domain-containing protein n=1 Tax=Sagittula sp. SSi028 TaxID=3400636 RepID=UPI003AF536D6
MAEHLTWGWLQPGPLAGFSTSNQDNLDAGLNGQVLSVATYKEYLLRDADNDGVIYDEDRDDTGVRSPGEGIVIDGVLNKGHEIAVYSNSTITVNGVDHSVNLIVTVLENGAWGVRLHNSDIQDGWYPADITAARLGTFNGVEYSGTQINAVDRMLCFAPETPIQTPDGWRRADSLSDGDQVMTYQGPRPLIWTAQRRVAAHNSINAPVVIPSGVLGARAVIRLSPLHRVMVTSPMAQLLFGSQHVLLAARHLLHLPQVRQRRQATINYVHLMTRRHTALRCPGLWCETFQAGPWARRMLPQSDRIRLESVYSGRQRLRAGWPVLGATEARLLLHMISTGPIATDDQTVSAAH